jgi:signal transduction histidine kinase
MTLMLRNLAVCLLLMVCAWPASASSQAVVVRALAGVSVSAMVNTTEAAIKAPPRPEQSGWMPLGQPLGQGFGEQVYWVQLVITVPPQWLDQTMVVRFQPPNVRDVQFFLPDDSILVLGTESAFEQRLLGFPDIAASFVATEPTTVIHIRLATAGRMFGTFELMPERTYYQEQSSRSALHGFFYGVLLLALLVNMLNWLTSRQAIYGFYVGFVFFSVIASLAVNGYLHAYLLTQWPQHHGTVQLWAFLGMVCAAILFAARMLRFAAWRAWLDRGANLLAVALLVLLLPASLWTAAHPYVWELVLVAFMVYGMGSLVVSLRNFLLDRSLQNGLLAIGYLVFSASQWVSIASVFGLVPATPINVSMWQIGLVMHLVLLQMALVISRRRVLWLSWQQDAKIQTLKIQAELQARRSRDLQEFIERLTHEFKTPLAVIDSSVQSLMMIAGEDDPARTTRYQRIRRAVSRLNSLLMRTLVSDNQSLRRGENDQERCDVASLMEAAIGEFTSHELNCSHDVVVDLEKDSQGRQTQLALHWVGINVPRSIIIQANVGWLHAAIHHVLDNAIKYRVGQALVTVRIGVLKTDDRAEIDIAVENACDTALTASDLPKLFEKYYRKGEQSNEPGAGLGLAMARRAIQAQGGTLLADLIEPGQIIFHIRLPIANHEQTIA